MQEVPSLFDLTLKSIIDNSKERNAKYRCEALSNNVAIKIWNETDFFDLIALAANSGLENILREKVFDPPTKFAVMFQETANNPACSIELEYLPNAPIRWHLGRRSLSLLASTTCKNRFNLNFGDQISLTYYSDVIISNDMKKRSQQLAIVEWLAKMLKFKPTRIVIKLVVHDINEYSTGIYLKECEHLEIFGTLADCKKTGFLNEVLTERASRNLTTIIHQLHFKGPVQMSGGAVKQIIFTSANLTLHFKFRHVLEFCRRMLNNKNLEKGDFRLLNWTKKNLRKFKESLNLECYSTFLRFSHEPLGEPAGENWYKHEKFYYKNEDGSVLIFIFKKKTNNCFNELRVSKWKTWRQRGEEWLMRFRIMIDEIQQAPDLITRRVLSDRYWRLH